jgi:hypothetical protein
MADGRIDESVVAKTAGDFQAKKSGEEPEFGDASAPGLDIESGPEYVEPR